MNALYATLAVTAIALLLGAALKFVVENESRVVERDGLAVSVPARWVLQDGAGDTVFIAFDPLRPNQRYSVASIPAPDQAGLPDAAAERIRTKSQLLQSFSVLSEGPSTLGATVTHEVRYAFVEAGRGSPVVIEGIEHYVPSTGRVLVFGLEAPSDAFAAAEPRFERFARQAAERAGP